MCMHVYVEQTVGGGAQYAGAHCKGRVDRSMGSSPRHARVLNVTAGMVRARALHRTPHSARMAQAPRSLCHKLTYPLLQRDRSVPRKLGRPAMESAHGTASQSMPSAPGDVLDPVVAVVPWSGEEQRAHRRDAKQRARGVAEACYIHAAACTRRLHSSHGSSMSRAAPSRRCA
jgi:hypothetical protein